MSPKRANRLRLAWFTLGLLAGVCTTFAVTTAFHEKTDKLVLSSSKPLSGEVAAHNMAISQPPVAADAAPVNLRPTELDLTVRKGDTLSSILMRAGASDAEAHSIITALRKEYNPRRLTVGQKVHVKLTEEDVAETSNGYDIAALRIRTSATNTLHLTQSGKNAFDTRVEAAKISREVTSGGGTIRTSLYQTGVDSGLSPVLIGNLINAYSYDVDFQRDIKQGDSFQVLYETMKTDEGQVVSKGKMLSATLTLGGQEKKIYSFTDSYGNEGFYDIKGNSVRKALLRTPINGARLSSGFGMRKHPILGYSKMHKGVDFAAATGTPVYAAGDGVVEYSGRKGGYGNYIRVGHNKQYSTAYAHLSKISNKVRKGARVKQGDVIGFVGSTGNSTGPHLHYELLAGNTQVNPKNVKFQTGNKLEGKELVAFKSNIQQLEQIASRLNDKPQEQKLAAVR